MPMVGGRAAEYAGWWIGGLNISISNIPVVTDTVYRTPAYSLLQGDASPQPGINIPTSGNIDLTGYTSLSGFNNARLTNFMTVYLEWPTSGIPSTDPVNANWANQLMIGGSGSYYNPVISLTNNNTQLQIQSGNYSGAITTTLAGSYTSYVARWITLITSAAETSSVFTSWSGGSGSGLAVRLCLYDSVTGERLSKTDNWFNNPAPSISSLPTTVPTNGSSSDGLGINFFGSSNGPTQYTFRLSNAWFAAGTCFDPLSSTDTSWRTSRPSATIGGCSAWYNLQTNNYANPSNYYITASGMDRYSQTSNYISQGFNSTQWTNMYSNTIFVKDSS